MDNKEPIAIFAGRGILPKILIDDCLKNNRQFKLFLLEGENYEIDYAAFNPVKLPYGAIEKFLDELKNNKLKNIIFIGAVHKPNFSDLKVDKTGAILLAKILASKILGDDAVLRTVINFFEKQGLKILKIDDILQDVLAKKSILTKIKPNAAELDNIDLAKHAIKAMSKFDIGQGVVVAQKQIIAVEAVEGTDAMISRCGDLKINYKEKAILVKMKKSQQSTKADLPTIGLDTIKNCHANKISGIAVEAGATLIINKDEVIKLADELEIFIIVV